MGGVIPGLPNIPGFGGGGGIGSVINSGAVTPLPRVETAPPPPEPTRKEGSAQKPSADAGATDAKRRFLAGFASNIKTSTLGLTDQARVLKQKLGQ